MLRSDLCDYCDAYIVVKGTITFAKKIFTADGFEAPNNTDANANATNATNDNVLNNKKLVFKNNAAFINCISKINGVKIDNAEDLDVAMPTYNLLEYSKKYKKQQEVCGIIIEMNQEVLFLLILNLLNLKQVVREILIMLVLVKKGMMQIKLVKMKLKLLFP